MKCKNCGAELVFAKGVYFCTYCQSSYFKEEFDEANKTNYLVKGGVLVSYNGSREVINIPSGVLAIGPGVFKNNLLLKEVIFSDTVTSIGKEAFNGCVNLRSIKNYSHIHTFEDECFRNSGLEDLEIGENVVSIGKYAFANNNNLKVVNYHPNKNLRLAGTFIHCSSLATVNMDKKYFFPSFHSYLEVRNNPGNKRPTYADAFADTPYMRVTNQQYLDLYKQGICPDCGGTISKGLFHSKCQNCGIDLKN